MGFDPNSALSDVYERIKNCHHGYGKAQVRTLAFEDALLDADHFDIAFTSPPYLNYEEYSDDADQSYIRYPDPSVWREKFLAAIPRICARALKPNGVMAINISDAGKAPLVDWLVHESGKIASLKFIGTLIMPTSNFIRANEGIYCWRKC
jgi:methylase of polypeptide subunit release factors